MIICHDLGKMSNLNYVKYVDEKKEAGDLFYIINYNLQREKPQYAQVKDSMCELMIQSPYFLENLNSMLLFFHYCSKKYPKDLLFVSRVFTQFMKYFKEGPYRTYAVTCMTEYLLNVNDKSVDFEYFCDSVLSFFPKIEMANKQEVEKKIILKKNQSYLLVIEDALKSSQIMFAISKCLEIHNRQNLDIVIKRKCLTYLIKIYKKLNLPELVEKYRGLLKD